MRQQSKDREVAQRLAAETGHAWEEWMPIVEGFRDLCRHERPGDHLLDWAHTSHAASPASAAIALAALERFKPEFRRREEAAKLARREAAAKLAGIVVAWAIIVALVMAAVGAAAGVAIAIVRYLSGA